MAVGVPEMEPVDDVLKESPVGSEPLVMVQEAAAPPVFVGVMVLMATFLVNVYGPP